MLAVVLALRGENSSYSRGHEGKLIVDMALDNLRVDDKARADVVYRTLERGRNVSNKQWSTHTKQNETGIGGQVELGDADAADSAIVLVQVSHKLRSSF
jgi:hypothetical protein